jgi:hypothetical protein
VTGRAISTSGIKGQSRNRNMLRSGEADSNEGNSIGGGLMNQSFNILAEENCNSEHLISLFLL